MSTACPRIVLIEVPVYSPVDSAFREIVIGAVLVLFLRFRPRRLLPGPRFQLQRLLPERRYVDRLPRTNL
jgi:hypothetical protein